MCTPASGLISREDASVPDVLVPQTAPVQQSADDYVAPSKKGNSKRQTIHARDVSAGKAGAEPRGDWCGKGSEHSGKGKRSVNGKGGNKGKSSYGSSGKGGGGRGPKSATAKMQCQFVIGIEEEPKFKVVRKILGSAGANVKAIAEKTDAKLRLRGRGSKFFEGEDQEESSDPLMLCLSIVGRDAYETAKHMVAELLEQVYSDYDAFLARRGEPACGLRVQLHEGYRDGSR